MVPRNPWVLLVFLLAVSAADARTWTDRTGRLHVEAEFIAHAPGRVWLRRDDGRKFEIAMSDLSEADQQYVRELVRRRNAAVATDRSDAPGRIQYGPGRRLCELANKKIDESSGLACSRRHAGLFWTHNDSGGDARLYRFDSAGRDLGGCELPGVIAYDWEDLASFESDGTPYLLVGDVGNNGRSAPVQMLHLIEEPELDPQNERAVPKVPLARTIFYSYEDDYRDCEAVAVDPTDKTILLVTKEFGLSCSVYALAWPEEVAEKAFVARRIGTLKILFATAMDVSPDGRRAVVATYTNAYEYVRNEGEDWTKAFSRLPREIVLPPRKQGESVCYGPDGKTLYLTSEKLPTPLWEVPVARPD